MSRQCLVVCTSLTLGLALVGGAGASGTFAAVMAVPTIVVKELTAATQPFPLLASGETPQTGFALRAQIGDGLGPAVEPVFTEVRFDLPIWQQFPSLAYGGPVTGASQYAEAGITYAEPGRDSPAAGEVVRLGVSTAGVPAGLYALALTGTDIGADTTFVGTNGISVPTTITNGQLLVFGSQLSVPASMTNAIAHGQIQTSSLSVAGRLTVAPNAGTVVTSSLSVSGFLDLTNNDMIVRGTSIESVRALVSAWYTANDGLPGAVGLGSSAAFYTPEGASTTLAVYDNSVPGDTLTTFNGIAVQPADVLVKYTYLGDTNLDGVVDAADLSRLLQRLNGQGSGWNFGDINYDGVIDTFDLGRTLAALRGQGAPLGSAAAAGPGGAITEPMSLALIALLALLLHGRRR